MKTPELIMAAMEERIEELEGVCKLVDGYLESEMPYADLVGLITDPECADAWLDTYLVREKLRNVINK